MFIRKGTKSDIQAIYDLIEQQALHHQVPVREVKNTPERLHRDAFGEDSFFKFLVAEKDGQVVGTAIYYFTYSTWKGRSIYLEDLIVDCGERGQGIGQQLFEALVKESERLNVSKLKWQVSEDNRGAIRFYERFDAGFDQEWINCTLSRAKIQRISEEIEEREEEATPV